MNHWLNSFVEHVTSIGVAVGLVAWLGKKIIEQLLKSELEQFKLQLKHSHDLSLAQFKQHLDVEAKSDERIRREIIAWSNPVQDAAMGLEKRLKNILYDDGYRVLHPEYVNSDWSISYDYFLASTLYLFAKYFCWVHMLRLELSFELFRSPKEKQDLFERIEDVSKALGDCPPIYQGEGHDTQVFRLQQESIGQLVAFRQNGKRACRGYSHFISKLPEARYSAALDPVKRLIDRLGADERRYERLRATHRALEALIRQCDATLKLQ